nr:uncharacterized protein LOC113823780 [Penaeus vannamei]
MLAVAVANNHEGGVGGGCGRPADEEDLLLTRLRQMQSTLRECHWRLDRTDRWAESLFRKGEKEGAGKEDLAAPYLNGKEEPLECDPRVREGDVSVDKKPRRRGLVVREGVCKESIIESEVVEELVLRKEWEDDFDDYGNLLMTDAYLREAENTQNAAKEVKKNPTAKPRLERQNSLDVEVIPYTVPEPKSGPKEQCAEDVEEIGVHDMYLIEKKRLSLPRNFDENEIRFFSASPVSSECEYERITRSETPGSIWRKPRGGMRQANSLPNFQGCFDFGLEFALFKHLDSVEESLENLRLQFFTLKDAITHSTEEDSEFDLLLPDPWFITDQKEPKTQEPRSKRDPKHRDPTDKTVPEDPADEDKSEHLKPEAPTVPEHRDGNELPCSTEDKTESAEKTDNGDLRASSATQETTPSSLSLEDDLETTTPHITKEREKNQRTRTDARQYEDFQRCLMTVIIVFFLLLMLLLLACYLLVVVPFVTVSYRHAEGTAVF